MSADDTGALGHDAPTDLAARVVDRDGDVWARHGRSWGCLTTASTPQTWQDLMNVCGPLHLAARVEQARAGEGALRERVADAWDEGYDARGVDISNEGLTERTLTPNPYRESAPDVTKCPDCGETGRYDRRVTVNGRGIYACPNRHRWQDADETPDSKGYTPLRAALTEDQP